MRQNYTVIQKTILQKPYRFIQKDVFVHISALERSGIDNLNDDQAVTFDLEEQNGKISAVKIELA